MKITLTTTSASLDTLLSDAQKAIVKKASKGGTNKSIIVLNPQSVSTVHIEIGATASTSTSMPIGSDKTLSLTTSELWLVNLVASGTCDIYLLASQ